MPNTLILKKNRERSLKNFHPWIFSGAVERLEVGEDGEVCDVLSHDGQWLAIAYVNRRCSILGRVLSFVERSPQRAVQSAIESAVKLRKESFDRSRTDAYRVINGEGDGLPGLIVDRYADCLVVQVGTLGVERLKPLIVECLRGVLNPKVIFEKSNQPTRNEEGLKANEAVLLGELPAEVQFLENGLHFAFDPKRSQKTGFFLDQREMRSYVGTIAHGRSVLNCFSYSGAFSVYAAKGGALAVDSVDSSEHAVAAAARNFEKNGFATSEHIRFHCVDAFKFLRELPQDRYDLIILDPPAFAKRRDDVASAARGYNEINRLAMQAIKPGGVLVSCSCSHFVDEELFQKVLFGAARDAQRFARIIGRHRFAADHPVSIFHPEGSYLKSVVLSVQ